MRERIHKRVLALFIAVAVFSVHTAAGAAAGPAVPAAGLDVTGLVTVDGQEAAAGGSFFSGGRVVTARDSEATINLGSFGRVRYAADSAGALSFADAATSGSLEAGQLTVSKPEGVSATFTTADATVAAGPEGAAVFSIDVAGGATAVTSLSGRVTLRGAGAGRDLTAGETVTASRGGLVTQNDDDDDDGLSNEEKAAIWLGVGGGIALVIILATTLGDDDEEVVISPSR